MLIHSPPKKSAVDKEERDLKDAFAAKQAVALHAG